MKKAIYIASAFWMALFLLCSQAHSQSQRNPCFYTTTPSSSSGCIPVSSSNPLPVAATATIGGGFTDAATGSPISVTSSAGGVTGTLPTGTVVAAFNTGATNTAFCKLGATATTSDIAIPPASWFAFAVGASTQLTCITSTSTTTVNMVGGSGLPTGSGGGGGGGGSSGAVFGPTANGSPAANPPVLIGGTIDGTAIGNVANWKIVSGVGFVSAVIPSGGIASGGVASGAYASGSIGSGAYASGSIGSGAVASGAVSSGAYAAGALAAGAFASGAGVDGWDLTQGAKTDAAWASGSGSVISLLKAIATTEVVTNRAVNLNQYAGNAITCTMTAYGTAPTGNCPGFNVFVTNTNANGQVTAANSSPVVIASDQTAVKTLSAVNQTPTNCSGTIATGGTAQNAFTAQTTLHGFTIANIDSGHNDEVMWISFTTTAAASTAASYPLPAPTATTFAGFGSFTSPTGFGTNVAVSVIAATSGHIYSCTWW